MKEFGLVFDGTWHDGRKNVLTGDKPKVSNLEKTNPKSYKRDQEGRDEKLC